MYDGADAVELVGQFRRHAVDLDDDRVRRVIKQSRHERGAERSGRARDRNARGSPSANAATAFSHVFIFARSLRI